jgi:hypothetical protein
MKRSVEQRPAKLKAKATTGKPPMSELHVASDLSLEQQQVNRANETNIVSGVGQATMDSPPTSYVILIH